MNTPFDFNLHHLGRVYPALFVEQLKKFNFHCVEYDNLAIYQTEKKLTAAPFKTLIHNSGRQVVQAEFHIFFI